MHQYVKVRTFSIVAFAAAYAYYALLKVLCKDPEMWTCGADMTFRVGYPRNPNK